MPRPTCYLLPAAWATFFFFFATCRTPWPRLRLRRRTHARIHIHTSTSHTHTHTRRTRYAGCAPPGPLARCFSSPTAIAAAGRFVSARAKHSLVVRPADPANVGPVAARERTKRLAGTTSHAKRPAEATQPQRNAESGRTQNSADRLRPICTPCSCVQVSLSPARIGLMMPLLACARACVLSLTYVLHSLCRRRGPAGLRLLLRATDEPAVKLVCRVSQPGERSTAFPVGRAYPAQACRPLGLLPSPLLSSHRPHHHYPRPSLVLNPSPLSGLECAPLPSRLTLCSTVRLVTGKFRPRVLRQQILLRGLALPSLGRASCFSPRTIT